MKGEGKPGAETEIWLYYTLRPRVRLIFLSNLGVQDSCLPQVQNPVRLDLNDVKPMFVFACIR